MRENAARMPVVSVSTMQNASGKDVIEVLAKEQTCVVGHALLSMQYINPVKSTVSLFAAVRQFLYTYIV